MKLKIMIMALLLLAGIGSAVNWLPESTMGPGANLSYYDSGSNLQTFDFSTEPADGGVLVSISDIWSVLAGKYLDNKIVVGPSSDTYSFLYDYTTDGIDDQVQLTASLDDAKLTGHEVAWLSGTYNLADEIIWPYSDWDETGGISLRGAGMSTILYADFDTYGEFYMLNMTPVGGWEKSIWWPRIEGVRFSGSNSSLGTGIKMDHVFYGSFRDMKFGTMNVSITNDMDEYNCYSCRFENIECMPTFSGREIGHTAVEGSFGNCIFSNCYLRGLEYGIHFSPYSDINIVHGGEIIAGTSEVADFWSGKAAILDEGHNNKYDSIYFEYTAPVRLNKSFATTITNCRLSGLVVKRDCTMIRLDRGYWLNQIIVSTPSYTLWPTNLTRTVESDYGIITESQSWLANHTSTTFTTVDDKFVAQLDAEDEWVEFRFRGGIPYQLPTGNYNVYIRAKSSTGTADDLNWFMYDNTVPKHFLTANDVSTVPVTWTTLGPLAFTIDDDEQDQPYSAEDIYLYAKKYTATANTIYVDYITVEWVGPIA